MLNTSNRLTERTAATWMESSAAIVTGCLSHSSSYCSYGLVLDVVTRGLGFELGYEDFARSRSSIE